MPPKDTPLILHRRFDDFDALTDAAREWDLDFLQLDRGGFEGEVLQATAGRLFFSEGRFGRKLEQRGSAPAGMRTFVVPVHEGVRFIWRRKHVESTDVLLFPHSGELHAISQSDFHVFTISCPEDLLYEVAEMRGVSDAGRLLQHEKVTCPAHLAHRIRQALHRFREAVRTGADPAITEDLESEIPSLLIGALDGSRSPSSDLSSARRRRAIARVKDLIAANEHRPLTVFELCQAARVSERTLQYSFLEYFGVTPKTYLKAIRLNGARKSLRRANLATTTVTEIAGEWGFWHMGQFAADYRKQFDELPSQTLSVH